MRRACVGTAVIGAACLVGCASAPPRPLCTVAPPADANTVTSRYDRVRGETTVYLDGLAFGDTLRVRVSRTFTGCLRELRMTLTSLVADSARRSDPPVLIEFIDNFGKTRPADVVFLLDGERRERFNLTQLEYLRGTPKEATTTNAAMELSVLSRLAESRTIEFSVGGHELAFTQRQIGALREFVRVTREAQR